MTIVFVGDSLPDVGLAPIKHEKNDPILAPGEKWQIMIVLSHFEAQIGYGPRNHWVVRKNGHIL
ncbi:hypothetical protein ACK301_19980 [Aeromonas caviae]|uniref:hypothetical protein n=1 Tax=Aeromonas caviae TaxID=648 RepID=UPI0038D122B1